MKRLFVGAMLAALTPMPATADTVFDNLDGISLDREGRVDRFSAMVVDGDGRIVELLDFGDDPTGTVDFQVDMRGQIVVPGFVDGHVRLRDYSLGLLSLDLTAATSLDDALGRIAAYAAAFPDRPWIVGHGWDPVRWGNDDLPTAAQIDALVADRPVWLVQADGTAGWANSLALSTAGVTAATRDPAGGTIARLPGSRAPAGVLTEAAMRLVGDAVPALLAEDRETALYEAQGRLFARGITAVTDMGTSIEDWMTYRRAGDAGWLRLRIISYADTVATMLLVGGPGPSPWLYDDRLRMGGVALRLDGTPGSRSAWLNADYADAPGERGIIATDGTALRNLMSRAALDQFQVAIRAHGDGALAEALGAIADLAPDYTGDRRWRIEHATIVAEADVLRFGENGTIASLQPGQMAGDHRMLAQRLGPDRAAFAHRVRSLGAAGGTLAFGSNAPTAPPGPLGTLAMAISREDAEGEPGDGWQPGEAISRERALAALTAGAAYAGFADGRFGRLVPGERADFVVLSVDPLNVSVAELRNAEVLETWVGGQQVFSASETAAR